MTDQSAAERAYAALKQEIREGAISYGPLDLRTLGDRLRMSVTPVREALARLNAERLVRFSPHHGYAVELPSARRLEQLYDLGGLLVAGGLERVDLAICQPGSRRTTRDATYAESVDRLFRQIAGRQANLELTEQICSVGDRLSLARCLEPRVLDCAEEEILALISAWDSGDLAAVQAGMRAYHRSRSAHAGAIARLLFERADCA